jgi:zinc protease
MHGFALRRIAVLAAALLAAGLGGSLAAQPVVPLQPTAWTYTGSDLTPDPAVVYGVLPNGLRYAIQRSNTPPGQVVMRLQVQAGSMHEAPDQIGYAHILEHLAFRGSAHLADGDYTRRLNALGAAFGPDINAFTTPQTTTFHIDLPRPTPEALDTGLLLMREVVGELLLKPETLESERGVILAEERTGATIGRRAGYAANRFIYQEHPYARPVVGTVDAIQAAEIDGVRRFYEAYYRPERTVLVIVGDVDPAAVEARIMARFSDWRGHGAGGGNPPPAPWPTEEQKLFLYSEPGLAPDVRLVWRQRLSDEPNTRRQEKDRIVESIALSVLANRLSDVAQSPNAAFRRSSVGRQQISGVAADLFIDVNQLNNWKGAVDSLYGALRGVLEAPIDQQEMDRVVAQRRVAVTETEARAATRTSADIAGSILTDAGARRVHLSPAQRRVLFDEAVAGLTRERIEQVLKASFSRDAPLVVVTSPAPIPGGEDSVRAQLALAKAAPLAPMVLAEAKAWPFTDFGPAGKVAERREAPEIGATLVRFENGVRLTVKPTKFRTDEVLVNVRFGDGLMGFSRTRPEPERALWVPLLSEGGLQGITTRDRNLFLSGKLVSLSVSMGEDAVVLSGVTRDADLDVQMQLFAADLTAAAWRPESFEQLRRQQVSQLLGRGPPQAAFRSRESSLLRSGDPRWATPSAVEVARTSYEQTRAFGQQMLAKGPLEVVVVGDVTVERAIAAVAATLGALPPRKGEPPDATARQVSFPAPSIAPVTLFHTGRPDQGLVVVAWPTTDFYQDDNGPAVIDVLREVLRQRLLARLRVEMGDAYSPSVTSLVSTNSPGFGVLAARVEVPPARMPDAFKAIDEIAVDLAARPLTPDEFAAAAKPYVETVNRQTQANPYWLGWLAGVQTDPRRLKAAAGAMARAQSVTREDVQRAAKTWLVAGKAWRGQIVPDPAMPPPPQADLTPTPIPRRGSAGQ